MIRSDMDALPVREETGLPFSSTHEDAMHACGHDGHMAMVLGAALVLPERMEKIIQGVCSSMAATYELNYHQSYPPTINDPDMADIARHCAMQVVGAENVVVPEATMGGEDMSFFLEKSKGCYLFLGTGREGSAPLHNSRFDFDEDVLMTGVEVYCRVVFELLTSINGKLS